MVVSLQIHFIAFVLDMDPGPSDASVLTRQAEHRSTWIWNGPDEGEVCTSLDMILLTKYMSPRSYQVAHSW